MSVNGRGRPTKEQAKQLKLAERRHLECEYRKQGKTLPEIVELLRQEHGIEISHQQVGHDIRYVLGKFEENELSAAKDIRQIQLMRVQSALAAIWSKVADGNLDAIHTMIRLLEREAKLTGADAPVKIDIEQRIRDMAVAEGLDPEESVRVAQQIIREERLAG